MKGYELVLDPEIGSTILRPKATMRKLTKQHSQAQYDRYVAQQIRAMTNARTKGLRDFAHWTDDEIRQAAIDLARINNAGETYA